MENKVLLNPNQALVPVIVIDDNGIESVDGKLGLFTVNISQVIEYQYSLYLEDSGAEEYFEIRDFIKWVKEKEKEVLENAQRTDS